MPAAASAVAAALIAWTVNGNVVDLKLDRGAAEVRWSSPSTFRFRRTIEGPLTPLKANGSEAVAFSLSETAADLRLRSKDMEVSISKQGVLVSVRTLEGKPIMSDAREPRADGAGVAWSRAMEPGLRVYGLGPGAAPSFDLRGRALAAEVPFLVSTAGYGEYHTGDGPFRFDFTGPGTYEIRAPRIDYFFYYGPAPKEVFNERHNAGSGEEQVALAEYTRPYLEDSHSLWQSLGDDIRRMTHAAMSGILTESFPLSRYGGATGDLRRRVMQVASLAPGLREGAPGMSDLRHQLSTFFGSYGPEKANKGYPIWHPLPFQFPDDPECAAHADEFMLGDEVLVAPIYTPDGKREVYLPQGLWTDLETNRTHAGRRTITVQSDSLPLFARNGTIVPFDSADFVSLHYFPRLGAEFFILEPALADWSVVHAAPAGDIFRLEIESKVARRYRWVVHNLERPVAVGFEDRKFKSVSREADLAESTWYYDARRRNLHIALNVAANQDAVLHVH